MELSETEETLVWPWFTDLTVIILAQPNCGYWWVGVALPSLLELKKQGQCPGVTHQGITLGEERRIRLYPRVLGDGESTGLVCSGKHNVRLHAMIGQRRPRWLTI